MKKAKNNTITTVVPYENENKGKKEQIVKMFDNIAGYYDFLNHFLSLGIDILWRKKAIKILRSKTPKTILDIATGTGDFAIASLALNPTKVCGVDVSEEMLKIGVKKVIAKNLQDKIELTLGDATNLTFPDNSFDAYTVGFGVRNFEDLEKGLAEMLRILKPNGQGVILEFSTPKGGVIKMIYDFYFNKILPVIGRLVSKDERAYTYLPESVNAFPTNEEFIKILTKVGYQNIQETVLFFGIATIYSVEKICKND